MVASLRRARVDDLYPMEYCCRTCIHERDAFLMQHFQASLLYWPQVQWVAESRNGRVVGYVMVNMDERQRIAQIRSVAVLAPYPRSGLATKLVNLAHSSMIQVYDAECAEVKVRQSNNVALRFFGSDTLGYAEHEMMNLDHEVDDGEPLRVLRKQLREREDVVDEDDQPRPGAGDGEGNPGDEDVGPANDRPDNLGLDWLFL